MQQLPASQQGHEKAMGHHCRWLLVFPGGGGWGWGGTHRALGANGGLVGVALIAIELGSIARALHAGAILLKHPCGVDSDFSHLGLGV